MVPINAINSDEACRAWYENLVEDVKQLLKTQALWSISFVHMEGNNATRVLAKYVLSLCDEIVWMEDVSNVISEIVLDEISNQ